MATQTKPAHQTTAAQPPAEQPAKEKRIIEFTPFGAKDKVQLSIEIVKRLVAVKTKTGKGCSDEDAFKFILMCQARKLNPFEGDAYLIGYDTATGPQFSLITAHQAFLKRAELHPEFDGMESGTIVLRQGQVVDLLGDWHMQNDNVLGGWATVYFKNRKYPTKKRLRLTRFNKGWGIWKDDPAGMIVKCAEADALRSSFPTMLGGMFIQEELLPATTAADIPRAVIEDQQPNGGKGEPAAPTAERTATATVVEPPVERKAPEPTAAPTATPAPAATQEKKSASLQRREKPAATAPPAEQQQPKPQAAAAPSDREKLKTMLAVGNCTPDDFVHVAVEQGWLPEEQGAWDKIPDERFAEFVKPENWALVTELLDEYKAAQQPVPAAATDSKPPKAGELL